MRLLRWLASRRLVTAAVAKREAIRALHGDLASCGACVEAPGGHAWRLVLAAPPEWQSALREAAERGDVGALTALPPAAASRERLVLLAVHCAATGALQLKGQLERGPEHFLLGDEWLFTASPLMTRAQLDERMPGGPWQDLPEPSPAPP